MSTLATVLGSLAAWYLSSGLVAQFSGRGLVGAQLANSIGFALAVGCGVAATVTIASRVGLPISTTHALIGSLVGAGLASGAVIKWGVLGSGFVLPLLLSPVVALALGWLAYQAAQRVVRSIAPMTIGAASATDACICVEPGVMVGTAGGAVISQGLGLRVAQAADCADVPDSQRLVVSPWLDRSHIASAMTICFARAVNDAPKLAALLLIAKFSGATIEPLVALAVVGLSMAVGGLWGSRRVAQTMSHNITRIGAVQGLAANLATTALVLCASKFSLLVSTTHVSVSSIAGSAIGTGALDITALKQIGLSWLGTLPLAAAFAYTAAWVIAG